MTVHLLALGGVALMSGRRAMTPVIAAAPQEDRTYIDLRAVGADPLQPSPPTPSPVGDETRIEPRPSSPQPGQTRDDATSATDQGRGAGRTVPVAYRRDRGQLHARLRDGSDTYQPSHERTSALVSSPQAIRQEPRVGVGDSARTRVPAGTDQTPSPDLPAVSGSDHETADAKLARDPLRPKEGKDLNRGVGPLDAEAGERRFDVPLRGVARDDQNLRAASNEARPGVMDLSAPATVGPGADGRGPGDAPGAVARPTAGANPSVTGAAGTPRGSSLAAEEAERRYARYELGVRERVKSMLRFPRRLALQLEQGESIVRFVVKPDGRLGGKVEVMKSAGFEEFDAEAVRAVTQAAPFSPPGRELTISLRVPFENPVIR